MKGFRAGCVFLSIEAKLDHLTDLRSATNTANNTVEMRCSPFLKAVFNPTAAQSLCECGIKLLIIQQMILIHKSF